MGSSGKPQNVSSLSAPSQTSLLGPLHDYVSTFYNKTPTGTNQLQKALLRDNSQQSYDMAQEMFSKAFLTPALRGFDTQIAPRINSQFAGIGGALSSRRSDTLARSLTDIQTNAQGQLAAQLPAIMNFPLQQTLGQIQGLGALTDIRYKPFNEALQFALTGTNTGAAPKPNTALSLLSTGATAAGAIVGGIYGGPAGAAAGGTAGGALGGAITGTSGYGTSGFGLPG